LTTGTASMHADDGQFCPFCRDVETEGSLCFEGDHDPACPDSAILACEPASGGDMSECGTPVPCESDADCFAPYESCEQPTPGGAFGQPPATTIIAWGSPGGDLRDRVPHDATLVSVHCVPPTFDPLIDGRPAADAVALPGALQLRPSPSRAFLEVPSGVFD
jgi:hypothetical protein